MSAQKGCAEPLLAQLYPESGEKDALVPSATPGGEGGPDVEPMRRRQEIELGALHMHGFGHCSLTSCTFMPRPPYLRQIGRRRHHFTIESG